MKQGLRLVILLLLAWSCLAAALTPAQRRILSSHASFLLLNFGRKFNKAVTAAKQYAVPAAWQRGSV